VNISAKVKICHIASGDLWAGAEVQVFNILAGLKKLGWFDLYAIIMNQGRLYEEISGIGINVYLVEEKKVGLSRQIFMIRSFIRDNGIRIIHSHRYKENILSGIVSLSLGNKCRLLKTQHGSFDIATTIRMKLYRAIDIIFTKYLFHKVITVSDNISTEFCKFIPKEKIVTIHNSLQPDKYHILNKTADTHIENSCLKIGIVGRLVKIKKIGEFIRIATDLHNSGVEISAFIAGDGPEIENLKGMARSVGASEYISFLGNIADVSRLYNGIDILFITSIHEGIPTVLLEAMYFGKIIIARKVGGIPEIIEHNRNGFLYDDVEQAKKTAVMICRDRLKYRHIRANARADAETKYTNLVQAGRYAAEYYTLNKTA
jgi:glycosyltransferase involved in cell wall biosynthesis